MTKLLLDSKPLVIIPELAIAIGLHEAIILQQIHYWLKLNEAESRNFYDGHYWTYNSYKDWQKQFPFWNESTIRNLIRSLEGRGLLIVGNFNKLKIDRTKWYRINYNFLPSATS